MKLMNVIDCELNVPVQAIIRHIQTVDSENIYFVENHRINHENTFGGSIHKLNVKNKKLSHHVFEAPADFIASGLTRKTLYYAYNQNGQFIIKAIDLDDFTEKEICTLDLQISVPENPFFVSLGTHLLLSVPSKELQEPMSHSFQMNYYFQKNYLIDINNKTCFNLEIEMDNDSLLRLDGVWVAGSGEEVLFKTGRIRASEKQDFWDNKVEEYSDKIETLILCKISDLIEANKNQRRFQDAVTLYASDESSTVRFVTAAKDKIIYYVCLFKENRTIVKMYDVKTQEIIEYPLEGRYAHLYQRFNSLYGVKQEQTYLLNVKDEIIPLPLRDSNTYVNTAEECEIHFEGPTVEFIENKPVHRYHISLYNLSNKSKIAEYAANRYILDVDKNVLLCINFKEE